MSSHEIQLWVYHRATHAESIQQRHTEFVRKMAVVGPPLGFAGTELPAVPACGDELVASFWGNYVTRGLKYQGFYTFRGPAYEYEDRSRFDDNFQITFRTSTKEVSYKDVLHEHFPKVVEAYSAYRAMVGFDYYWSVYRGGIDEVNPTVNELLKDKTIDVDGRNNIYTLGPAQYWDSELCELALGYPPEEVIRRVRDLVPRAERLMNGVYVVWNDDPQLTYEQFVEMNQRYKAILGIGLEHATPSS